MVSLKNITSLIICILAAHTLHAQVPANACFNTTSATGIPTDTLDQVYKNNTAAKPLLRKFEPAFDFDQRFYYIQNRWSNVWGYREGLIVNEKWKVGIGEYYSNESANSNIIIPKRLISSGLNVQNTVHNQQLYLGNLYFEPYLIRRSLYEFSLVFEAGYGKTVNYYQDINTGKTYGGRGHYIIPAGEGVSFNLKFPPLPHFAATRWFGINAVGGYRESLAQGDRQYSYNGYYWSVSTAIFLDRMLVDYKHWRKDRKNTVTAAPAYRGE